MTRRYSLRLFDILNAIRLCERALAGKTADSFAEDDIVRLAVERALEIVSEASRHIPDEDKVEFDQIPWLRMADLGNFLRHAYDRVMSSRVFETATESLETLKPVIEVLYARHKRPSDPWPDAQPRDGSAHDRD